MAEEAERRLVVHREAASSVVGVPPFLAGANVSLVPARYVGMMHGQLERLLKFDTPEEMYRSLTIA